MKQYQDLLRCFRGENSQIKSQIAFAYFIQSLQFLDNDQLWLQILKQMIIIDKLMQENLFLQEINKLSTFWIRKKKFTNPLQSQSVVFTFLNGFWKIIKNKTQILLNGSSIFSFKRSQRQLFLKRLSSSEILNQIKSIQSYMKDIFDFISILSYSPIPNHKNKQNPPIKQHKNNIYVYLVIQMLYKLLGCHSCQNTCNQQLIKNIKTLNNIELQKFKNCLVKFKQNCNGFNGFVNKYKFIQGFQIMQSQNIDTYSTQQSIKIIQQIIDHNNQQQAFIPIIKLPFQYIPMKVEQNVLHQSTIFKDVITPRLTILQKYDTYPSPTTPKLSKKLQSSQYQQSQINPFNNWNNSYSNQFPQKQIMTVDLIVQLKLEQSQQKLMQQGIYDQFSMSQDRSYVSFLCQKSRSTNATSTYSDYNKLFVFKQYPKSKTQDLKFNNLYSRNHHKWNT